MSVFESTKDTIHVAVLCPYYRWFRQWADAQQINPDGDGKLYFHVSRLRDIDGRRVDEYLCLRGGRGLEEHDDIMKYIETHKPNKP